MGQVGNLLNRNVTTTIDAAAQAAGLAFLAVNLDIPDGQKTYLSGIDFLYRASVPAETAVIQNMRVEIFENLTVLANLNINVQLGSAILLDFMDTDQVNKRFFTTRFTTPWQLDANKHYSILAFPIFDIALTSIDSIDLTVLGIYGNPFGVDLPYYGQPR